MVVEPQVDPDQEKEYEAKFRKAMSRLRGSDFLTLEDKEEVEIVILSDVDNFEEYVAHKIPMKGRALCQREVGQPCPYCEEGIPSQRGLGLGLLNRSTDMIQVVYWTKWKSSPLNDIEDAYAFHKVPVRGMRFSIRRRGTGKDTLYLMKYLGHEGPATDALPEPPDRAAIANVLNGVFSPREPEEKK